ncbi:MAG: tetratricopeptide repeat protein, partial [Rhizobacter sp.]|nr:tetratricopeptide repeat protein [Chlorobiales bacterium]
MKRTRATFLLLASAALTVVLSVATFSPSLLAGEKKDDKKGKSTPDTTAALATTPAEDALTRLARLIPRNSLKAKTGDVTTDNVFANYSLEQVQLMLVEYDKKLENATIQKQDLTRASLETGDRFLKTFPDSRVIDEIAIRQADLLYEKVTDEYQVARVGYDKELQAYYDLQSKYDSGDTASGLSKPIEPDAPKSNLNQVIALYDLIINNMPESPYVVDALYGKAYIYGERTEEYVYSELTRENYPMLSKENEDSLKLTIRRGKKQESITLLQEITRKYPDSRYTIDSYMLIGEYLFDGRPQPGKTIEAIAYYQKALNLMASSSTQSKYYDQALYKLGWSYYRLGEANPDNYREAIAYFTDLTDDIVKVEELYANKILPDFVRPDLKDEAIEYAASGFLSIQKKIDPTKSGVDRVERYFAAMSPERRYEPVVYEKLGKLYEDLLVDPEMVNEIYGTLLRRFPKYERAPLIAQKIIDQLDKATLTEQGKKNVEAGDRLYEERKRLFYSYGKTSPWFADLQRRIIAQNSGDTLAYADRATLGGALDPTILDKVDSITRIALYKNIEYGSDLAEVLAGYREAPLGTTIEKDPGKANVLYRQVVADADEYVKLFSRYDSSAYEALWNRSVILDQRLNRSEEAVDGYIDLAKNHAYTSHRRDAIFNSYGVMDSVMRSRKQGRFTTYADSPRFSGAEIPLTKEEEKFVEVNEAFIRLYPHDTLSITATNDL